MKALFIATVCLFMLFANSMQLIITAPVFDDRSNITFKNASDSQLLCHNEHSNTKHINQHSPSQSNITNCHNCEQNTTFCSSNCKANHCDQCTVINLTLASHKTTLPTITLTRYNLDYINHNLLPSSPYKLYRPPKHS